MPDSDKRKTFFDAEFGLRSSSDLTCCDQRHPPSQMASEDLCNGTVCAVVYRLRCQRVSKGRVEIVDAFIDQLVEQL